MIYFFTCLYHVHVSVLVWLGKGLQGQQLLNHASVINPLSFRVMFIFYY